MKKLPSDFVIEKYGVRARLVNENDAGFILKLRTDEELSKYIHDTSSKLQDQIHWIREYKKREAEGIEYYFVYSSNGRDFGLNRLYNIDWQYKKYTCGSWICERGSDLKDVIATTLIPRIVSFDILGLVIEDAFDGVHENNKKVIKYNEMVGMRRTGTIMDVKGRYYTYQLLPAEFKKGQHRIEKLLDLK